MPDRAAGSSAIKPVAATCRMELEVDLFVLRTDEVDLGHPVRQFVTGSFGTVAQIALTGSVRGHAK
jgi:hypothetical protein